MRGAKKGGRNTYRVSDVVAAHIRVRPAVAVGGARVGELQYGAILPARPTRLPGPSFSSGGCYVAIRTHGNQGSISQHRRVKRGQDMQVSSRMGRWWPLLGRIADDESGLHVDIVLAPILDGAGAIPTRATGHRPPGRTPGPPGSSPDLPSSRVAPGPSSSTHGLGMTNVGMWRWKPTRHLGARLLSHTPGTYVCLPCACCLKTAFGA